MVCCSSTLSLQSGGWKNLMDVSDSSNPNSDQVRSSKRKNPVECKCFNRNANWNISPLLGVTEDIRKGSER